MLSQASSALLFTQPLASSPPENPAPGLPLLRFIRESSDFLQLGTARQRSRRRKKNKRKRRRGSSDVPRGRTDDSEAHLDLLQPPEAVHEFWGQSRRSGTAPLPAALVGPSAALLSDGLIAVDGSKGLEVAARDLSPLQICLSWCCQRDLGVSEWGSTIWEG